MKNVPAWFDGTPIRTFPRLQKNMNADVLVVGGGVTGITTAYLLKKAGLTVILIERERVASIDTGHTTAHLTYVTDVQLQQLVRNIGKDHAQAAWDAGAAAIDEIERIVEREGIRCDFGRVPAYLHAPVGASSKKEASYLRKEADIAVALGFDADYLNSAPYFDLPAVRFANQAKFSPQEISSIFGCQSSRQWFARFREKRSQ
jgi:glycine/D-amino acid oxidase-like deaminating enzyme